MSPCSCSGSSWSDLASGLVGLITFERRYLRRAVAGGQMLSPSRLALLIAAGIGLHNFSEGLAIGQSAGGGELAFAGLLIVGFGLHNATEGFGIVGPLMGKELPSWGFLGLVGLIGGGPDLSGHHAGLLLCVHCNVRSVPLAGGRRADLHHRRTVPDELARRRRKLPRAGASWSDLCLRS